MPASAAGWERPPFAAALFNDILLYGRGVLDTKGLGIAQLEAFLALKRSGKSLSRDVVFLATADEERGGRLGVSAVFEKRPAWLAGVGEVLGEGGDVETIVDTARWFGIEVQQKGALWLRLEAGGAGGHAASADESGPAGRVARAAARLAAMPRPVRLEPVLERQLTALARVRPPGLAASLRRIAADVARDPEGVRRQVTPWQKLLLSDTVAVTRLGTDSEAVNAHPKVAWAEVDVRLLPSTSPEAFLADAVKAIDDPGVKVTTLLSAKGEAASPEEGLYVVAAPGPREPLPGRRRRSRPRAGALGEPGLPLPRDPGLRGAPVSLELLRRGGDPRREREDARRLVRRGGRDGDADRPRGGHRERRQQLPAALTHVPRGVPCSRNLPEGPVRSPCGRA